MTHDERELPLEVIDEPAQAMRSDIPRDEVFELAQDIKKNGLINPITVRPVTKCLTHGVKITSITGHDRGCDLQDKYEVVAGHRRFLAHRYGGIPKIRCIVRELTDDEAFAIMTSENLKRENVNPVDEAIHTERLMRMHNGDVQKVSDIVNRGRDWVESRMQIAQMPDELKDALRTERIKLGVALAISQITDEVDRRACLDMAVSQGASVVIAQYWLAQWKAGLFGHALERTLPDSNAPGGQRTVVMLRCSIDGKEYPATEFVSMLVRRDNLGYVEALRSHLNSPPVAADFSAAEDLVVPGSELK